jgi:sulfur carrier protein ThiS
MNITVEYVGFLKLEGIKSGSVLEFPEGTTAAGVLDGFGLTGSYRKYIVPIVNSERSPQERALKDGDHLFIYLPVGGG